ncbi:MAG: hypothetical protein E7540_04675 [Ruminococcaceae bacterium]|nr:hypothetical protein [Oscillospiraceae bacterium]
MELQEILKILEHGLLHPLKETVLMAPILFLAYLFMEWLEHNGSLKFINIVNKSRRFGPLISSVLGLVPQCGFSGAIAGMYAAGTVTAGTLIAVILATSDEMLPMMIPSVIKGELSVWIIVFILILKFVSGLTVGFAADLIRRRKHIENEQHIHEFCEQEHCSCESGVFKSAIRHTFRVLIIVYIVSAVLHFAIELIPQNLLTSILNFPVLSQLSASLLGLIPSCAVSVTLTELYLEGALGIAPLLCGLLTNGGVGLLVLYRVNKNKKDNLIITFTVFISGLIIGSVAGLFF